MAVTCCICGANVALVGWRNHHCISRPDAPSPNEHAVTEPASDCGATTAGASRNARWRAKNRERYNAGMRDLMRRRRAAAKAAAFLSNGK